MPWLIPNCSQFAIVSVDYCCTYYPSMFFGWLDHADCTFV